MGCDIHSVAQVKKNGVWKTVLQDVAGDHRSYDTFAMLADVRNGSGFAGVKTGGGFEPISQPKGFPDDFDVDDHEYHLITPGTPSGDTYDWAEPAYREARLADKASEKKVWMGDHSYSWLSLPEINAYIKRKSTEQAEKCGYVEEDEYLKLRGTNEWPKSWCGGAGGGRTAVFSASEYEALTKADLADVKSNNDWVYVHYTWKTGVLKCGNLVQISEELGRIAEQHGVGFEDVRMVFGFDS